MKWEIKGALDEWDEDNFGYFRILKERGIYEKN